MLCVFSKHTLSSVNDNGSYKDAEGAVHENPGADVDRPWGSEQTKDFQHRVGFWQCQCLAYLCFKLM